MIMTVKVLMMDDEKVDGCMFHCRIVSEMLKAKEWIQVFLAYFSTQ